MVRAGLRLLPRLLSLFWAAGLCCVAACTPLAQTVVAPPDSYVATVQLDDAPSEQLPESEASPRGRLEFRNSLPPRALPISLDTVLRLTESQNLQIHQARLKVNAALADKD